MSQARKVSKAEGKQPVNRALPLIPGDVVEYRRDDGDFPYLYGNIGLVMSMNGGIAQVRWMSDHNGELHRAGGAEPLGFDPGVLRRIGHIGGV